MLELPQNTMKHIAADILRIIDANLNRTGEGLRVLEEFARLSLNDEFISQKLKNLRHKVLQTGLEQQKILLNARDAAGDVGSVMDVPGESKTKSGAPEIIIANARRVQESLRVLEELAKTPDSGLDSEAFRQGRFELYSIEKELLGRISRQDSVKKIAGLYVVIDTEWLKGRSPGDLTLRAIEGGAQVIQLRCKNGEAGNFLKIAMELKEVCASSSIPFIINDRLEVALACKADGLHIGQEDLPAKEARKLIPIDMLLGVSVKTAAQAKAATTDGADYLGVGAVFATATKDSIAIGLNGLKLVKEATALPLVAIGGINRENIQSIIKAGAVSAAVISAVLGADDVEKAAAALVKEIRKA